MHEFREKRTKKGFRRPLSSAERSYFLKWVHFIWIDDILAFALKGRISCKEFDSFPARRYF